MNKVLYIILISLFSLSVISCSQKDESSSSRGSSITLSDVSANIAGSKYIITTESSGGTSGRSNAKTNSKTESLLVISESGEIDYGLISNNQLVIKYNILSPSGDYLYLLLDTSDANTVLLQLELENSIA